MPIQRYDLDFHGLHGEDAFIGENGEGEYVRFADYEALKTDLLAAAKNAAATVAAIYQWVERVEAAGGATNVSGVAACHAMLTSLRKNASRTDDLVMAPLRAAIAKAENP